MLANLSSVYPSYFCTAITWLVCCSVVWCNMTTMIASLFRGYGIIFYFNCSNGDTTQPFRFISQFINHFWRFYRSCQLYCWLSFQFQKFPTIMEREAFIIVHGAVLGNNLNSIVVETVSLSLLRNCIFSNYSFVSV